ncbi:MAG: hypothetical protein DMG21_08405 [Acidobacteria bacterium]|nr:MAG: hypothetical protein DMG21_08405 [Acidobacteriota bacterium]
MGEQCVRCLARPDFPDQGRRNGRLSARSKLRLGWQAVREAARWRPDLTIATHLNLGPIAWSVASLARRPYWIVVYGIEAWSALPGTKRAALRQADRVIVISTFSREQVARRHQINGERLASLPCTLDESLLMRVAKYGDPGQRDWLSSWSLPWQGSPDFPPSQSAVTGNKRVVLTVGRMAASERYKGHEVVLRALPSVVAKIPDLTYVVVGDGDDRPRLEKLAGESELREHVVFTGEVSDSELAAFYQRSEVFVLPARTVVDDHDPKGEGFGIVFLEAMAFGKPVVGPNYGAPVELVRDGETGLLVDPENPASVGEALLSLLTNPDRGREMGNAGSEWVRRNYSYGSFRERLREMLLSPAPCG